MAIVRRIFRQSSCTAAIDAASGTPPPSLADRVEVTKGQPKVYRQRDQRQPCTLPDSVPKPAHSEPDCRLLRPSIRTQSYLTGKGGQSMKRTRPRTDWQYPWFKFRQYGPVPRSRAPNRCSSMSLCRLMGGKVAYVIFFSPFSEPGPRRCRLEKADPMMFPGGTPKDFAFSRFHSGLMVWSRACRGDASRARNSFS